VKKILLGALGVVSLNAVTITLYQDIKTGALYTTPGEGRIKLGEFVSKDEFAKEIKKDFAKELKSTKISSKVPKLKINGVHYLGFTHINYDDKSKDDISRFETRRNYFQVKGYWNDSDYVRITLDTFHDREQDGAQGSWLVRLKYAYIYFDNVLPYSGVEFGQVHRPWIDWEEHHGWYYRSVAKTFVEERNGAHLTNSADLGVNLKTKTPYFSSEIGVFDGEGYHFTGVEDNRKLSFEYRLTYHLLGTGERKPKPTSDTYADLSLTGQVNPEYKNSGDDFEWYGVHAVYNRPELLIAGMYADATNSDRPFEGKGWSVNTELRPTREVSVFGRYDRWDDKRNRVKRKEWIAGVGYTYNKYLKFIGNLFHIDPNNHLKDDEQLRYMFTAEVKW